MKAITLFALAVQALSASASLVKRVPYSPSLSSKRSDAPLLPRVQAPECVCPGEYLCCSELVSSADKIHYNFYDTLGVNLTGTNIQIGVACQRINFFGGRSAGVERAEPECNVQVCCSDSTNAEVAAFGCFRVV